MIKTSTKIQFRQERIILKGIPESLKDLSLLFLTDPHIGGGIDRHTHTISRGIEGLMLPHNRDNTLVLHGGDFMSTHALKKDKISFEYFVKKTGELFNGLENHRHFGVIGNHDDDNAEFEYSRQWLEDKFGIHFMTEPRHTKKIHFDDTSIGIMGIHTLKSYLNQLSPPERDMLLDQYIYLLNHTHNAMNVVLMHNPDGLEFLLERLKGTNQSITTPTLFLAGHTHGAGLDIPIIRTLGLRLMCGTHHGRYRGWYGPEGIYGQTGNWQIYVSTGMGNSPGCPRINAIPEVVLFTL